jgi:acyl-CoA synthetase (AMP-forming)/AMP-acid ligase II
MRNFPEYVILFWACALLGAVPALINPWLTDNQLLSCVAKAECKVHIVDPERADRFETLMSGDSNVKFIVARSHEGKGCWNKMKNWNTVFRGFNVISQGWELESACNLEDDCVILFTSGTTSMPKAVLSSQRAFISNHISGSYCILFDMLRRGQDIPIPDPSAPQGVNLLAPPLFHVSGLTSSLVRIKYVSRSAPNTGFRWEPRPRPRRTYYCENGSLTLVIQIPSEARYLAYLLQLQLFSSSKRRKLTSFQLFPPW